MPYEFREYPKMLHGADKASVIVRDREAEAALGEGWYASPDDVPKAEAPPTPEPDPAADKAIEDAKAPLLARAAAANLVVDGRWSLTTLTAKVAEAEAKASA